MVAWPARTYQGRGSPCCGSGKGRTAAKRRWKWAPKPATGGEAWAPSVRAPAAAVVKRAAAFQKKICEVVVILHRA